MADTLLKNALDLCRLLRCFLNQEPQQLEDMDLAELFPLASRHALTAISCAALEKAGAMSQLPSQLAGQWREEKAKAIRKNILLAQERKKICCRLQEAGAWYMPMKGIILAELYPGLGLRQMSDNDILFDPAYREVIRGIMVSLGYEVDEYGIGCHDVYLKPPVYNFEMHIALFGPEVASKIGAYYENTDRLLLPCGDLERKFSDEDFYVYFVAHGYKHFENSGNGLRFLLDCWIYADKMKELDWAYITGELDKMGLGEFDARIRRLGGKLFSTGEALDQEQMKLFAFCVSSGTYGTVKNTVINGLRRIQPEGKLSAKTRLLYMLRRIWPRPEWFEEFHPFVAKHPIVKPFFLLWRLLRSALTRGKAIKKELDIMSEQSED